MKLKPDLQVSIPMAQSIVDQVDSECTVATVSRLHGGEIAAVHEIAFADPAHRPLVLKVYPDDLHWKMQKGGDRNRSRPEPPRRTCAAHSVRG